MPRCAPCSPAPPARTPATSRSPLPASTRPSCASPITKERTDEHRHPTHGPPPSALRRTLRYAGHTTRMTVTNIFFMLFTIALPVGMYLLFGMLIGEQDGGQVRGLIMVNMAAYGGLGAAVTAGTQVQ